MREVIQTTRSYRRVVYEDAGWSHRIAQGQSCTIRVSATRCYVFDVPGDPRLGKFDVRVNINQKVRTPTGNRTTTVNSVRSGGMPAAPALKDRNAYDLVDGKL